MGEIIAIAFLLLCASTLVWGINWKDYRKDEVRLECLKSHTADECQKVFP